MLSHALDQAMGATDLPTLPDETAETEPAYYLRLALECREDWLRLRGELEKQNALETFLRYVGANVPFYREMGVGSGGLAAFPVARRKWYSKDTERFSSVAGPGAATSLYAYTNGTVAPQLKVRFSPAAWYDFNYGAYAEIASAIPGLSNQVRPGEPGVFLITNAMYQPRMSMYLPTLKAALLRQLIIGRSDAEDLQVARYLGVRDIPLLYGKASNLLELAAIEAHAEGLSRIRPHAILVSGERLYPDQREHLEKWYGCRVFDAYIATEGGLIAIECRHHCGLHIRETSLRAEILDDSGHIRETGRGELLLTNLINRQHVFVRYALGDKVEIVEGLHCACGFSGRTIIRLTGRDAEFFSSPEGQVPVERFARFLMNAGLREFQLIQSGDGLLTLKWSPEDRSVASVARINREIFDWLRREGWQEWVIPVPLGSITPRGGKNRRYLRVEGESG